jgi:hypothetical protein
MNRGRELAVNIRIDSHELLRVGEVQILHVLVLGKSRSIDVSKGYIHSGISACHDSSDRKQQRSWQANG